jgi:hypothetical protein
LKENGSRAVRSDRQRDCNRSDDLEIAIPRKVLAKKRMGKPESAKPEIRMNAPNPKPKIRAGSPTLGFWFSAFIRISGVWFRVLNPPHVN